MKIHHIGHSVLHSPTRNIDLKNILHVPNASMNLLSVNRIARDNNAFFEFRPNHFFVRNWRRGEHSSQANVKAAFIP